MERCSRNRWKIITTAAEEAYSLLRKTGFTHSDCLAVTEDVYDQTDLSKISDIVAEVIITLVGG